VALIEDDMRVGLGTGSTVRYAVEALGRSGRDVTCVVTSTATEEQAREVGLEVIGPDEAVRLDLTIDGADEVDQFLNLTKGGGGALTREKIVAAMADRFVVIVDKAKVVAHLGAFPTPVEVLPFATAVTADALRMLGAGTVELRDGLSDNGLPILDLHFKEIDDPEEMAAKLSATPGVVEHGIFLADMVTSVIVGDADGDTKVLGLPLDA
jgi:ribose 5-phosphate isomerase A